MRVKEAAGRKSRTRDQSDPLAFETLVRKLVAHAKHAAPDPVLPTPTGGEDHESSEDVLFACEVDGVRCVLARSHQAPADTLSLSPREHEIARMIAKGHPNKIIASVLDISVWTVSTHLRRMFAKLGVTSRTAMVTKMFKLGKW
jgi:two-component system nitrate/nitrite response regulator NarL